ncbi:MAG: CoA-binding protein [Pseudomonadota bacterium]
MDAAHPIPDAVRARLAVKTPATRIAVIGASNDPAKYGNIIPGNLKGKGYTVLPVNPREETIQGLPVFASPAELPDPVHIMDMVTPPKITRAVLEQLDPSRFKTIWLQDGSFDDEIIAFAEGKFDTVVHHACIMVVTNY